MSSAASQPTEPMGRAASDGVAASVDNGGLDPQLSRWGGVAGLGGVVLMLGAVGVVVAAGLPDASDAETLTDFADIESGRIAEHLLYLGAVVMFALHVAVLHRLLGTDRPAALFGAVISMFGLVIMAASSLLHVSTSPLAALHEAPGPARGDRQAVEYAWHGAQSVFDTMLATGVLLVPIGIVLLGVAMWRSRWFGHGVAAVSVALGAVGTLGAVLAVVDTESDADAAAVLAVTLFHLVVGRRTLQLGNEAHVAGSTDRVDEPAAT